MNSSISEKHAGTSLNFKYTARENFSRAVYFKFKFDFS